MGRSTVYNHIVNDDELSQVNPQNLDLLDEFKIYLQTTGRASGTIKNYDSDLKIFFIWLMKYSKNKFFVDINKKDIMFFQNYCINVMNVESARIRRLRSSLSSLSNYVENMLDDEYKDFRNIVNKIEPPPLRAARDKTVLQDDDITKLLYYLVENKEYQKACVLALACSSGARKSELLRFKASYFTSGNIIFGSLYKTPEKILTKGKGGKMLYKYTLKSIFQPYLELWLKEREVLGVDIDYLFVIKQKDKWKPMKITSLNYWTKEFSDYLGVDFYFHSCRHYWTTYLYKAGLPESVIVSLAGWGSADGTGGFEMFQRYNDSSIEESFAKYFSENGINSVENKGLNDL